MHHSLLRKADWYKRTGTQLSQHSTMTGSKAVFKEMQKGVWDRPPNKCVKSRNYFSYFSTKTYVVGTQKNRLNETILLSSKKHMFKLIDKKLSTFLHPNVLLIWRPAGTCS